MEGGQFSGSDDPAIMNIIRLASEAAEHRQTAEGLQALADAYTSRVAALLDEMDRPAPIRKTPAAPMPRPNGGRQSGT